MNKPTVVIGASSNPDRYSYKATVRLKKNGNTVFPVGLKEGDIEDQKILAGFPPLKDVHTVTLYVGPKNQGYWTDYILSLNPKRIIFNPGAENPEFSAQASAQGIECIEGCTLVMMSIGNY